MSPRRFPPPCPLLGEPCTFHQNRININELLFCLPVWATLWNTFCVPIVRLHRRRRPPCELDTPNASASAAERLRRVARIAARVARLCP